MEVLAKTLQASLPNFPEEVLVDWLLPYAATEGWPPADSATDLPKGRWRYLLRNSPLDFWRSLRWEQLDCHLPIQAFTTEHQGIILSMVLGAVRGQRNVYSDAIPDLTPRFNRIIEHIVEHGTLPRPPCLLAAADGLTVLDGNHRLAAYYYCYEYFKLDIPAELHLKASERQRFWVARTP